MVGSLFGDFQILGEIGRGGMGVVYLAEDRRLRRKVALKLLPPDWAEHAGQRERLLREARAAAAVSHPNVAVIYQVGEEQGRAFIAMERVEGRSLRDLVRAGPLPLPESVRLMAGVADGVAAAHALGIVHRDLKPDNVVVGADGRPRVLDFGLAKLADGQPEPAADESRSAATASLAVSLAGAAMGTPCYMSPEQAAGRPVDARSDVFALGLVLYELVAGRRAFGSYTPAEALVAGPAAASPADPRLPLGDPGLERIVARCLERLPDRRYPNAGSLACELHGLAARLGRASVAGAAAPARRNRRRQIVTALAVPAGMAALVALVAIGRRLADTGPRGALPTQRRLTWNPAEDPIGFAAPSPDGRWLAWSDSRGLHLREHASGETVDLHSPPGGGRIWSLAQSGGFAPDSSWIAVSVRVDGDAYECWRVTVPQGAWTRLPIGPSGDPSISPDGSWLSHLGLGPDGRLELRWAPVEGDGGAVLRRAGPGELLVGSAVSPDGRRIAFATRRQGGRESWVSIDTVGREGGQPATVIAASDGRLSLSPIVAAHFLWLPDGRLAWIAREPPPRGPDSALWAVEVDPASGEPRGEPRRLATFAALIATNVTVLPGMDRLVLVGWSEDRDVQLAELRPGVAGAGPRPVTTEESQETPSDFSPDGRSILLDSTRNGNRDVFRLDLAGAPAQPLVVGPGDQWGARFLGGGDAILYWSGDAGHGEDGATRKSLVREAVGGRERRRLLEAPGDSHLACGAGGTLCLIGQREGERLVLSEVDPWSGAVTRRATVEAPVGTGWDLSPDGARVALAGDRGEVRVLDLASGSESCLAVLDPNQPFRSFSVAWLPDGHSLLVSTTFRLFLVSSDGSVVDLHLPRMARFPLASPDGHRFVYQSMQVDNDVWLMEGWQLP